jgi:hypothetical protein
MSGDLGFTLIDPSAFSSSNFSVDAFLVSLTKDVIGPTGIGRGSASFAAGKDALTATEQVQRVQRLLGVLARCALRVPGRRAALLRPARPSNQAPRARGFEGPQPSRLPRDPSAGPRAR